MKYTEGSTFIKDLTIASTAAVITVPARGQIR